VLVRFRRDGTAEAGSDAYPGVLDIDLGEYENHEDAFTGRHRAELVRGDDDKPLVVARVTVPVRKAV
jgi:hypothetical protein